MRVLVVEDDEKIARLLKIVLEENNYEVEVAHDGEKAMYLYETYNPHLIVLDLMLPKIDGFQFSMSNTTPFTSILSTFLILFATRSILAKSSSR